MGFWERANAAFNAAGITVSRVLTDNGSCYRSYAFKDALGPDINYKSTPLPATDQRQSRTIQPHLARRMGLRPALYLRSRACCQFPCLAAPRQSQPRPHLTQEPTTHQPRHQPSWVIHLGDTWERKFARRYYMLRAIVERHSSTERLTVADQADAHPPQLLLPCGRKDQMNQAHGQANRLVVPHSLRHPCSITLLPLRQAFPRIASTMFRDATSRPVSPGSACCPWSSHRPGRARPRRCHRHCCGS